MKPDSIGIEPASWRDLGTVRHLEQVCFPLDAWPLWDIIGVLTFPGIVRLKAVNTAMQLVGFVAGDIRRDDDVSWIATIAVLPAYQGQGIGRRLLEACEKQLPTSSIRLCVRTTNDAAIHLYETAGYERAGNWKNYYQDGADALVMEKRR